MSALLAALRTLLIWLGLAKPKPAWDFHYEDKHVEAVYKRLETIVKMATEAIGQVPELKGWYPLITIAAQDRFMSRMDTHVTICPPDYMTNENVIFVGPLREIEGNNESPPSVDKFTREFEARVKYEASDKSEQDQADYTKVFEITDVAALGKS